MDEKNIKEAMFGAGCFWGVQSSFDELNGVIETEVGYAGGHTENPTYKDVCSDKTGHAEVVHVKYDANILNYSELLKIFWEIHDPTTVDRQGPDIGSQYRSIIFYYDEEQKKSAENFKSDLNKSGKYDSMVITEIVPVSPFWRAEEYHQKYFQKTGRKVC